MAFSASGMKRSLCKKCNSNRLKAWRSNNNIAREKSLSRRKIVRERHQTRLAEIKSQSGCIRCEQDDWRCLEFHHFDPTIKEFTISIAATNCYAWSRIERELCKCEIVCGNCHRLLHFQDLISDIPRVARSRSWYKKFRQTKCCKRCKNSDWRILCGHHVHNKLDSLGTMVGKGYSVKLLEFEAEKCEIICINCHRIEHTGKLKLQQLIGDA